MEEVTSHLYYYCVDGSVLVESKELHVEQNWHLLEKAMCICETEQNFLAKSEVVHSWECGESGYSYSQVGEILCEFFHIFLFQFFQRNRKQSHLLIQFSLLQKGRFSKRIKWKNKKMFCQLKFSMFLYVIYLNILYLLLCF